MKAVHGLNSKDTSDISGLIQPPSTHAFAQVCSTLVWVPSEDMRLGRVEAGDMGPWWVKEDEEEVKEEWDE